LICSLIEENFLNESRYARLFAGGHFRLKKWGKIKIRTALHQKRVSEANIRTALQEIDPIEYAAVAEKLAAAKFSQLGDSHPLTKQAKTLAYLLQKGYETGIARAAVQKNLSKPAK
ncbi:MAG TPA: regulatory protein RecX, partial [Sediminibacterium sp.]|nr:regulatory protein RecX [Sediminibacterium sp.]